MSVTPKGAHFFPGLLGMSRRPLPSHPRKDPKDKFLLVGRAQRA